ncbi:hypothetical protein [Brachyspira innocens]|uniref:hypothetical protein n=1 Tax=Brachyspira innocens TaxID=13264 RepID=UPI00037F448B|nr:hypothetical protein [Brachyspira innocens]
MKNTVKNNNTKETNNPIGGDFFDYLKEENLLEECLSLSSINSLSIKIYNGRRKYLKIQ